MGVKYAPLIVNLLFKYCDSEFVLSLEYVFLGVYISLNSEHS